MLFSLRSLRSSGLVRGISHAKWLPLASLTALLALAFCFLPYKIEGLLNRIGSSIRDLRRPPLIVACAAPLTGPNASAGIAACNSAEFVFDRVNEAGGIGGRSIRLLRLHDGGGDEVANQLADKVSSSQDVVAAMGRSLGLMPVPIVSLGSLARVTNSPPSAYDEWSFETEPADPRQAELLAFYAKVALHATRAATVSSSDTYDRLTATRFITTAQLAELEISKQVKVDVHGRESDYAQAAADAMADHPQAIFLAMRQGQPDLIARELKRRNFEGVVLFTGSSAPAASFSDETPVGAGNNWAEGGYFSSPLAEDSPTETRFNFTNAYLQKYGRRPDVTGLDAHDAALVIVEALKAAGPAALAGPISQVRTGLRDKIVALDSPARAVEGLMGPMYFDKKHVSMRPLTVVKASGNRLLSAEQQIQVIDSANLPAGRPSQGNLKFGGLQVIETQVVRTGIVVDSMGPIDDNARTFDASFHLWFVSDRPFDASHIVFKDTVKPVVLGTPDINRQAGGRSYTLFRVQTKFRYFVDQQALLEGQRRLNIRFYAADQDRSHLELLPDLSGMGLANGVLGFGYHVRQTPGVWKSDQWSVAKGAVYADVVKESTLGDPDTGLAELARPTFSAQIEVQQPRSFGNLVGLLVPSTLTGLGLLCFGALFLASLLPRFLGPHSDISRLLRLFLAAMTLLLGQRYLLTAFGTGIDAAFLEVLLKLSDTIGWVLFAMLLTCLMPLFVWRPLARQSGADIPEIVHSFTNIAIYFACAIAILLNVYGQSFAGIAAASGVFTLVIGLAAQNLILDAFAGLLLNIQKPFRILQWVTIHGANGAVYSGQVMQMTWRTTTVKTADNDLIGLPNSMVSQATIVNYAQPSPHSRLHISLVLEYSVQPEQARRLLEEGVMAAMATGKIVADPAPYAAVECFEDRGIRYRVYFYTDRNAVQEEESITAVADAVIRTLASHGVQVEPSPNRVIYTDEAHAGGLPNPNARAIAASKA